MEARVLQAIVGAGQGRGDRAGRRPPRSRAGDRRPGRSRWEVLSMRELLRPRLPRLLLAVVLGVLSLGSALALAGISAWLITRAWQMPPVLDLTVAVVAVRALGISRGVLGYCERLASHDTALRAAADTRERLYRRLADAPAETAMRLHSGELVARVGDSVDELSDVLVRAVLPIAVAAVLSVGRRRGHRRDLPRRGRRARRLPADRGCRRAMAGRPCRRCSGSSCSAASFRARRRGDARPGACARTCGSVAASTRSSPNPSAGTASGAAPPTGPLLPPLWPPPRRPRPSASACSAPSLPRSGSPTRSRR